MTHAQRGAVLIGLLEGIYHHIDLVVLVPAVLCIILVLYETLAVELWFETSCLIPVHPTLAALTSCQFEQDAGSRSDGIYLIAVDITQ